MCCWTIFKPVRLSHTHSKYSMSHNTACVSITDKKIHNTDNGLFKSCARQPLKLSVEQPEQINADNKVANLWKAAIHMSNNYCWRDLRALGLHCDITPWTKTHPVYDETHSRSVRLYKVHTETSSSENADILSYRSLPAKMLTFCHTDLVKQKCWLSVIKMKYGLQLTQYKGVLLEEIVRGQISQLRETFVGKHQHGKSV